VAQVEVEPGDGHKIRVENGTPACCSLPSLPVATERAAAGIPSGDDRRPVHVVASADVRSLPRNGSPLQHTMSQTP
jgi:hypothetical protein